MFDFITLCDGYKLDHRRQYPKNTHAVYSNLTARASRVPEVNGTVFFGLQYFLERYLMECAKQTFFDMPKRLVCNRYRQMLDEYLGPNPIGTEHIAALHDMGHVPLQFNAVPEGTYVPLRIPMCTWENTHPDFYWVTNYIETLLSMCIWGPITSATTALRYRRILDGWAGRTGGQPDFVDYQAHDFSMRGMMFPEASALSGLAHALSFNGSDALPVLQVAREYYGHDGAAIQSVAATEHAVMCAGSRECEEETFRHILELYPTGIVSVVSDTWDLWNVLTEILPRLRKQIMERDGKLVIRPDSGDPVDIICGTSKWDGMGRVPPSFRGAVSLLYDVFGGTMNAAGFIELDPHIGCIYGDSITPERANEICRRLAVKGFASTNVTLGVGSYTYQHVTRDTYGLAVKATWAVIDGTEHLLFKDPITDDGTKRSARGRFIVTHGPDGWGFVDGLTVEGQFDTINAIEALGKGEVNMLKPVWANGQFIRRESFAEIRKRVRA